MNDLTKAASALAVVLLGGVGYLAASVAQMADTPKLESLKGIAVPQPAALDQYVKDRDAAVALGKALFWDMSVGSDGVTACASCHFQAGADNRTKNQLSPGLLNVENPTIAHLFNKPFPSDPSYLTKSNGKGGPNYALTLADFPLHVLSDPLSRDSAIVYTTDDVVGSQGVVNALYAQPGKTRWDDCVAQADPVFHVNGTATRRVAPRNSPTTINAVFNVRNFWDGRANDVFNGFSPFGNRDPDAGIFVTQPDGNAAKVRIALENSSAASQAVGPPGSDIEMTCGGRSFPNLAKRLLPIKALYRQAVHSEDSVLASYRNTTLGVGLTLSYEQMVRAAFANRLWDSTQPVTVGNVAYKQIEANFALFFGLAIQMYESTLVSDDAPLDRFLQGDTAALTAAERRGMQIFLGQGKCINCHAGPELTNAATRLRRSMGEVVERMSMADSQPALYDNGFYNIGVRPTGEDLGLGATDPWGHPLSYTRQYLNVLAGGRALDSFQVDPCKFEVPLDFNMCLTAPPANHRVAVDGAFKTSTLRNVELTGPYFHNGSRATLEQVVEFYNRGGDRRGSHAYNTSGFGANGSNLDSDIEPLGLTAAQQADLVAFLKRPLTDQRVRTEKAPFDRPQLFIPNGHSGNEISVQLDTATGKAKDAFVELPAVGRSGRPATLGPLRPFASQLR